MRPRKPIIGLVGGIGAGKSSAAAAFARRGGVVVDCDKLGHDALGVAGVLETLVERWGEGVRKADGTANRRAIAEVVFSDAAERKFLEATVFPVIGELARAEIARGQADPAVRFVVLDAAVMLEAGWNDVCDQLVYVDAPRELRVQRLAARSGWTDADLAAREAAQLPAEVKKARADAVVLNDDSPTKLQEQVDLLLENWGFLPA